MINQEFTPATTPILDQLAAELHAHDLIGHLTFTIITPYDPQILLETFAVPTDLTLRHQPVIVQSQFLQEHGSLHYHRVIFEIRYEFETIARAYAKFLSAYSDMIIAYHQIHN